MKNKILLSSLMAMTLFSPVLAEDSNNKTPWYKTKTAYFVYAATGVTLTLAALEYYEITHIKDFVSNLISSDSSNDDGNTDISSGSGVVTPEVTSETVSTEVEADSSQESQALSMENEKEAVKAASMIDTGIDTVRTFVSTTTSEAKKLADPVVEQVKKMKQNVEEKYPTSTLHAFVENVKGTAKSAVDGVAEATHAKEIKNSIDAKTAEFIKQHPAAAAKAVEVVEHIGTNEIVPGGHFE